MNKECSRVSGLTKPCVRQFLFLEVTLARWIGISPVAQVDDGP